MRRRKLKLTVNRKIPTPLNEPGVYEREPVMKGQREFLMVASDGRCVMTAVVDEVWSTEAEIVARLWKIFWETGPKQPKLQLADRSLLP